MIQIDMQMPSSCYDCWIRQNMGCRVANDSGWLNDRRDDNCPLIAQKPEALDAQKRADTQRDYQAAIEMTEYCKHYEPTYNVEDGSM